MSASPAPRQPAINARPLGFYIPGDVMGTPVRATYWGIPGDDWVKVVDTYRVDRGALRVERVVFRRSQPCAST